VAVEEGQVKANLKRMEALYEAGDLVRLHTVRTVEQHTIARHVYGSMVVAMELCELNGVAPGPVLQALLYHDAPEVDTGDIPAPVKRASPDMSALLDRMEEVFVAEHSLPIPMLGDLEGFIVKTADTLDLVWTCLRERRLGNKTQRLSLMFIRALSYLETARHEIKGVSSMCEHLSYEWEKLR
jgi:5'-deoxynucleotidase YfbR-like HD superfamily hydrolase